MFGILLASIVLSAIFTRALLVPLITYWQDPKGLRRFPSVSCAAFTNLWGVVHQYRSTRTLAIHQAHLKHGRAVRVGPAHVSFSTFDAVKDIYGHGTPAIKDNFYGAFASTHLNVSDAQEKVVHNVKRKRFATAFAQKNIVELETVFSRHLSQVIHLLDRTSDTNGGGLDGKHGLEEAVEVDMKSVMLGLMYDSISVLLFGVNPGFLERGSTTTTAETIGGKLYQADIHKSLCGSLRVSTALGWAPQSIPFIKSVTRWHDEWQHGNHLRDITIHRTRKRLQAESDRTKRGLKPTDDFMSALLYDKKSQEPLCLEFGEILTEAQNLFNAAGENTEIALTNIIWLLAKTPHALKRLREELQPAFENTGKESALPSYHDIQHLPYLRACIDEGIRLRPSLPVGLPRLIPQGGMQIAGEWFNEGTTVSVSTYTLHRDEKIFGEDADEYRPERWLDNNTLQRAFLGFSQGGRACIGRNIAYFEMSITIATLFWRYDFELPSPDWELPTIETLSGHTGPLPVRVTRRAV
ncbi:hypothetical protein LTR67_005061 [Exophiala xenobiotica]